MLWNVAKGTIIQNVYHSQNVCGQLIYLIHNSYMFIQGQLQVQVNISEKVFSIHVLVNCLGKIK